MVYNNLEVLRRPSPETWLDYPVLAVRRDNQRGVLLDDPRFRFTVFLAQPSDVADALRGGENLAQLPHLRYGEAHHLIFDGWLPETTADVSSAL